MYQIEIDFDVFKALTQRRTSESMTENDVIRELLGLARRAAQAVGAPSSGETGDWISKGVRFPAGTEFRAAYKGQSYMGRVEGGMLVVNGERFATPSSAAMSITRGSVNGWGFWECRLPGKATWQKILTLRR